MVNVMNLGSTFSYITILTKLKVRSFSLFLFSTRWYPFLQEPPYGDENDNFFPLLTCSRRRRPGDTLPAFHYNRLPKSCGGSPDGATLAW